MTTLAWALTLIVLLPPHPCAQHRLRAGRITGSSGCVRRRAVLDLGADHRRWAGPAASPSMPSRSSALPHGACSARFSLTRSTRRPDPAPRASGETSGAALDTTTSHAS
jgi:hypothetical protein